MLATLAKEGLWSEELPCDKNYRNRMKDHLFKILDKLLGHNSRELLKSPDKNRYFFNVQDVIFINAVLDFYECEEDRIRFLNEGKMEIHWKKRLKKGFILLGENPNIRFTSEDLEKRWRHFFFEDYELLMHHIDNICFLIQYFVINSSYDFDVIKEIDDEIKICDEIISKMEGIDKELLSNLRKN